jgi:hypothetical protein
MSEVSMEDERETAQDVVDAIRFALVNQNAVDGMRVVELLLQFAPEPENDRGLDLLRRLLAEGVLKVQVI